MAGLVGYIKTNAKENQLTRMMDRINHRGPDYRLTYEDDVFSLGYLGLDLKHDNDGQELFENDEYVALLCGYIYNVDEIQAKVQAFDSTRERASLIEEILFLYTQMNDSFANLFKGTFLIVIYDKKSQTLKIVRDVFGLQPFFYYPTDKGLIFASEAKAMLEHVDFKKELNTDALRPYFVFQSSSLKESFFKGMFRMEEASILTFGTSVHEQRFWDVKFQAQEDSIENIANNLNEVLGYTIKATTDGFHTPIGSFLSEGIDSSYITARSNPAIAFTIGYDDSPLSEIALAQQLAGQLGIEHKAITIDVDKMMEDLPEIQYMLDEPSASFSAIPLYYLGQMAKERVDMVLGGEGADEFFGGYFHYVVPREVERLNKLPKFITRLMGNFANNRSFEFKGRNLLVKAGLRLEDWYIGPSNVFTEKQVLAFLKDKYKTGPSSQEILRPYFEAQEGQSELVKKQYVDMHHWMMNDINQKADRMSMASSLQLIAPIVNQDVFAVASRIPDKYKVDGYGVKLAFREATKAHLPASWVNHQKKGFPVPFKAWLQEGDVNKQVREVIFSPLAEEFFNLDLLKKLLQEHESGKREHHRKIFAAYFFLLWYKRFFIDEV